MKTFKKHDIVRHIKGGHIGKVLGVEVSYWDYCNDMFNERPKQFIKVCFFDLKKRYSGLFEADNFELYRFNESTTDALNDWMATPAEELRNTLKNKQNHHLHNRVKQGKIRLD